MPRAVERFHDADPGDLEVATYSFDFFSHAKSRRGNIFFGLDLYCS